MSKIIYVVTRENRFSDSERDKIEKICDNLSPDNIISRSPKIKIIEKIAYGFSNPSSIIRSKEKNVFFGQSFDTIKDWEKVNGAIPDGNYAIFRANSNKVEIITDILGTKAVWYYHDENIFIASTSQRAIVQYLGKFQFNENVIPWMLCNGLLGPGEGWDISFSLVPADSVLTLNREKWEIQVKSNPVEFSPNNKSDKINQKDFDLTVESVLSNLSLDYSKWSITLSGGYDSRGILYGLNKTDSNDLKINTLTWGLEGSPGKRGNDAYIAKKIARGLKVPNTFFPTDFSSDESLEKIISRFLKNGEGRIDHVGGYMDGFKIWKTLYENDILGIIRGDEAFGSYNFISKYHLKQFIGLTLPEDYNNLKSLEYLSKLPVKFPEYLKQKPQESTEMWRDRLYQSYLIPVFLSALEDIKQPYLEQINPLLSKKIINLVRELPDHLRTEKKIFKNYVDSFRPSFDYARTPAIESMRNIFKNKAMVTIITEELNSDMTKSIFPQDFISHILSSIQTESNKTAKTSITSKLKSYIPKELKKRLLKETFTPKIDMNKVAFRMFMISKMNRILLEDSKFLLDKN